MGERNKMNKYLNNYQKYHTDGFTKITNALVITEENKGLARTHEGLDAKFLTSADYLIHCESIRVKFIENKNIEEQIIRYPTMLDNPYTLGLYEAFTKWDMHHLLNVLYQASRHSAIRRGGMSSGTDHCNFFDVIHAFAANDIPLVNALLPKELGLCKNGHKFTVLATNMLFSLWYKDATLLEKTKINVVKFLSGKRTLLEISMLTYLMALADNNVVTASESLKNVCLGNKKSQSLDESKLVRLFGRNAHGLHHFARFILSDEQFKALELPNDDAFIMEYAQWNMENDFPQGTLFLIYPDKMALMNKILNVDIPKVTLRKNINAPKSQLFRDADAFKKELIQRMSTY